MADPRPARAATDDELSPEALERVELALEIAHARVHLAELELRMAELNARARLATRTP